MARIGPKIAILLLAAWLPACASRTATASRTLLFSEGNALYQKGDFAAAEAKYGELLGRGVRDGALLYNLGNACFKQKKLGQAIFYWERARELDPADRDIRENLQLAELFVVDRIEVPQPPLPVRWLEAAVHRFTPAEEAVAALALFVLANLLFGAYLVVPRRRLATGCAAGALLSLALAILAGASMSWKLYERRARAHGVVVEARAEVRSGPGAENVAVFTVHEGTRLRVRGESGDWCRVTLPNGWSGWLPRRSVWH